MTTANAIETATVAKVLSVPLESVVSEAGYSYVFKKSGRSLVRQMVETGTMNDNEIVVKQGVAAGDIVLLAPPSDKSSIATATIAGLKPITAPVSGGDTAKRVTVPAVPPAEQAKGKAAPASPTAPALKAKL
jgi:hypothetical protein